MMPQMKRLPAQGKPDRELADVAGELSLGPKYAPIPEFGVVVLESRHAPEWSAPGWFDEGFNKFLLLVSGAVVLRTRTQHYRLGPRSFCHLPAHTPHFLEDRPGDPVVLYVIHYRPRVLTDFLGAALASVPVLHWNLGRSSMPIAQPIRSAFQEMLFEQATRRVGWEAMLTSTVLRLAVRAVRFGERQVPNEGLADVGHSQSAEPVVAYLARLESGFFRQETLETAALSTGLSRRQFTRTFRRLTGTTWHEHVQTLRLKHARKLLLETDTSVLAISFECGFESPSNFHRAFKAAFGCAPSEFREENRPA
jgi:AraC-like DNA-binding protein